LQWYTKGAITSRLRFFGVGEGEEKGGANLLIHLNFFMKQEKKNLRGFKEKEKGNEFNPRKTKKPLATTCKGKEGKCSL